MSISITANRIMNGCLACMLLACLALWSVPSNMLGKHANSSKSIHAPKVMKKASAVSNTDETKIVTENEETQMRQNAALEMLRETFKPWIREALRDPVFRESTIEAGARGMDPYYADIYKLLELDDATVKTLRMLLAERSNLVYEVGMDGYADTGASPSVVRNQIEVAKAEHEEKIASLLGSEKYALLSEYENTLPQRNQISAFRQELQFSSEPLSVEQETALLPVLKRFSDDNASEPSMYEPLADEGVLDVLKGVLSSGQIDALAGLKERQESMNRLNYSWKAIGRQMRASK